MIDMHFLKCLKLVSSRVNDILDLDPDEPEAVDLPELFLIEEGMVFDVLSESDNNEKGDYCEVAMQEVFDQW